jgi:restriction system protein
MIREIPKFHETFVPILNILSNGKTIHTRELQKLVVEKYFSDLSEAQLSERTKTGEILINNRIAWGKSYLKREDLSHILKEVMFVLQTKD